MGKKIGKRNRRRRDRVTKLLDEVSYAADSDYIPKKFSLMFIHFIKLVNGRGGEEHPTPEMHLRMLDNADDNDKDALANLCHRGSAKTTIFGEYFILFIAVYGGLPNFGKFSYGLYVSDSIDNGVKKMRNRLQIQCDNSEFLQTVLEDTRFTDTRWYFKNIEGKELVFSGHGAETGVRGTVELRERPSLAIFDDLMSDKNAKSPTIIKSIRNTVYGAVDYALHPTRNKVIWNGTPFNARDPLYQAINSKSWFANVYPVCEAFPVKKKDFRSSWPDRFTYKYVKKKYNKAMDNNALPMFSKELMLRISSSDQQLVREEDIQLFDRVSLLHNLSNYNIYITTDFATTANDSADYSVIMVWAVNMVGAWMLVDGICKKQLMKDNVDDLFLLARKWKPMSVGIEISGQQGGYLSWLDDEMLKRGMFFDIASESDNNSSHYGKRGFKPSSNKLERFLLALPIIQEGKLMIARQLVNTALYIEFVDELVLVTLESIKSLHDDALDTFAQMRRMPIVIPTGGIDLEVKPLALEGNALSDVNDPFDVSGFEDNYYGGSGDEYGTDSYTV